MKEVPVAWGHSGGTRINPLIDGSRMFMEMLRIRWYDLTGKYDGDSTPPPEPQRPCPNTQALVLAHSPEQCEATVSPA